MELASTRLLTEKEQIRSNQLKEIRLRIQAGRLLATKKDKCLALAILALKQVLTDSVELVVADDKWRIFLNPERVLSLEASMLADLILVEVKKCLQDQAVPLEVSAKFSNAATVSLARQDKIRRYCALSIVNDGIRIDYKRRYGASCVPQITEDSKANLAWAENYLVSSVPLSTFEANFNENHAELALLAWTSSGLVAEVDAILENLDHIIFPKNREKILALCLRTLVKANKEQKNSKHEELKKVFETTVGTSEIDLVAFFGFEVMKYRHPDWLFSDRSIQQLEPLFLCAGILETATSKRARLGSN